MTRHTLRARTGVSVAALGALVLVPVLAPVATAAPDGSNVIINEYYARGGSNNAPFQEKFVELYNPTDRTIDLSTMSLQYRSATSTGASSNTVALEGTIAPGGYYLVIGNNNGSNGVPITDFDLDAGGSLNPGGENGTLALVASTSTVTLPVGNVRAGANPQIVDLIGTGTSNTYEGSGPAASEGGNTNPRSWVRTNFVDTDDNRADFTMTATITPQASSGGESPTEQPTEVPTTAPPTTPPTVTTIEAIQGTGAATPLNGQNVTTRGVVTAIYRTGLYNGAYIQTPGTGGAADGSRAASSGIFVYSAALATDQSVEIGDYLEVTGTPSEYYSLTQIVPTRYTELTEDHEPVVAAQIGIPQTEAGREAYEGMLLEPTDSLTVTDTYGTNNHGDVGLAIGDTPLIQATDVYNPVTQAAEHDALVAQNAARAITLEDGASWQYANFNFDNHTVPLPYVSTSHPVRVGAQVELREPVVLDFRYQWNLQPTYHLTGPDTTHFAMFENTRTAAPEDVGGDVQIATFNVLNYFTELGEDEAGCSAYNDRQGNPITSRNCDTRGAYNTVNFERQEAKIVNAILALDADVVALEEIENSANFGNDRDEALATLTAALNESAGVGTWAFVESPAAVPTDEDFIRTAFVYRTDSIVPVGDSKILLNSPAFNNAREPLAQEFRAVDAEGAESQETFVLIANHFKSKGGSGVAGPQGHFNEDRVNQANALADFAAASYETGTPIFLTGDFNAYTAEDPMRALEARDYTNITARDDGYSYSFGERSGSLDHILGNDAAVELVTGEDVWEINAEEAIALEYSRYNYNVTNFYNESVYRSSDHNPAIVGLDLTFTGAGTETGTTTFRAVNSTGGLVNYSTWKFTAADGTEYIVNDNNYYDRDISNLQDTDPTFGVTTFDGLPAGTYEVEALRVAPSYYVLPEPFTVRVNAGDTDLGDFEVPGNGQIRVNVRDEDRSAVGGATILVTNSETGEVLEVQDNSEMDRNPNDGYIFIRPLEFGTYTVEIIDASEGYEFDGEQKYTVTLTPRVPDPGTLRVFTVTEVEVAGPVSFTVEDSTGYRISNTSWKFTDPDGNEFVVGDNNFRSQDVANLEDLNDEGGAVVFTGLPAGTYSVENLSVASSWSAPKPFTVTVTGEEQDLGAFVVAGNGRISVLAEDDDGQPVAGATFRFTAPDGTWIDVVDGGERDANAVAGTVRVEGLELVTYTVSIAAAPRGYEYDAEQRFQVPLSSGTPARWAGTFVLTEERVVVPPRGYGFYLNDGWDGLADHVFAYGNPGDTVLVGDWDGNGTDTLGVRRGNTYYLRNSLSSGVADIQFSYGNVRDEIYIGDWDGNGTDTIAVRRGNQFLVRNSLSTGIHQTQFRYGNVGDTVLVGDWDGDGDDTLAVRRGNRYFARNSVTTGVADHVFVYGNPGDTVLVGDWDGRAGDTLGVRRGIEYHLRNTLTSGYADIVTAYGNPGDEVYVGDWNGDGVDTLGVRR